MASSSTNSSSSSAQARAALRLSLSSSGGTVLTDSKRPKLLFAVVHLVGGSTSAVASRAADNAALAQECGADGVFLCPAEHPMPPADTVAAVRAVRERVGLEFFVGANFMAPAPFEAALQCGAALDAVWTDDGVDVEEGPRARACERLLSSPARREWISSSSSSKFHFVGWLFKGKGRALPDDREAQMELLGSCVAELERFGAGTAICTTSGPGTGVPLEVERREPYRLALGQRSVMAVASGTTVDNVAQLVSSVDVFMVGTGIEKDETDPAVLEFWASAQIPAAPKVGSLDAEKIRAMAAIVHASADD